MLEKNQIIEVTVTALTAEGSGVARYEGMAVFLPLTAPGDRLLAKVVKVHSRYAFAIVQELLEPADCRVENDCPVFRRCGGCTLRHLDYSREVAEKARQVTDNLERIGGIRVEADPPVPSPRSGRYRNKAQYPVREVEGKLRAGFFAPRSHTLIPVEDCLLQPEWFGDICRTVLAYMEECGVSAYHEAAHRGAVRHIYIRHGEQTGQVMVCLVINGKGLPRTHRLLEGLRRVCPELTTLVLSHNRERTNVITAEHLTVLQGPGYIEDILCGVRVRLSPLSFYQVNREAAELLYRAALEYAQPGREDVLLDLYCGAGTIGLSMAHAVGQVLGVEVIPEAVEDARRNAKRAGVENARFLCGDAAQAAVTLAGEGIRPDIVVLDPPRKGMAPGLAETVAGMEPRRLVYISCNSATLARDCKELAGLGYRVRRVRAVDLFPRTAHMEAVALLERDHG